MRLEEEQEEQAVMHYHALEQSDIRRAQQRSLDVDLSDESEEDVPVIDYGNSSSSDEDEKENSDPNVGWTKDITDVGLPAFDHPSGLQSPTRHAQSALDFLLIFITPDLMQLIAHNTTLYAHSKGEQTAHLVYYSERDVSLPRSAHPNGNPSTPSCAYVLGG
jgi:hypothetical protein